MPGQASLVPLLSPMESFTEHFGQVESLNQTGIQEALTAGVKLARSLTKWRGQLEGLRTGKASRRRRLEAGDTPDVLLKAGARQLPMVMTSKKAREVMGGKHAMPQDVVLDLPALIPIRLWCCAQTPARATWWWWWTRWLTASRY